MATEYCPRCHKDLTFEVQGKSDLLRCQECGHVFEKKEQKLFGPFVATPGFCNISAAIYRTGIPVRDIWRFSAKLGIVPHHQKHRALWTNEEVQRIATFAEQNRNPQKIVLISGQVVCTTATITNIVGCSSQAVNEWARHHPNATVEVSGERMIIVNAYLEHLNSRQQILSAERLRSSTQP